jgi:predicted phosphodiesterase
MALVIGDIHGRLKKTEEFLNYRPKETHIFSGDYVDSFHASDEDILNTLKLVIESNAILIWGNHDVHYLTNAPFLCSGYNHYLAKGINDILESFIDRFVPATEVDGFVITHGGISKGLHERFIKLALKENSVSEILMAEWKDFLDRRGHNEQPYHSKLNRQSHSVIFNIPRCRGGNNSFGGIFWADYRDEEFYNIPQVFGHSKTVDGNGVKRVGPNWWALGCDSDKFECFNTSTRKVEKF